MLPYFGLMVLTVLLWSSGQVLLKQGVSQITLDFSPDRIPGTIVSIITNLFIIAGFGLSFSGSFCYLSVLSRMPLSWAYPLEAIGFVIVALVSFFVFREHIPLERWLGIMLIVGGIILVAFSAQDVK